MRTPVAFVALATAAWLPTAAAVALLAPDASDGFAPRLVVKFRPAGDSGAPTADRVARLAADTGIALTHVRTMAVGAQVLTSSAVRSEEDADAIAALLARHPDVAYAERSRRVRAERVPNDPLYASQFYLLPGTTTIDAQSAWDITTGSPALVVAVLDTGSTSHADLAGRVLPGYDFVANFTYSNDGNVKDAAGTYRDADASDPGDWVSTVDLSGPLAGSPCSTPRDSSWHGTSVMGTIAANADNGSYVTGVDWHARILPVRVLGKCYGDDIDAADGIAWAAGVAVPNAPPNPNPAHVINLSLGDPGACPQFFREAIDAAFARGVTRAVVASAGNQASGDDHFPSSCPGVLSIGASTFGGNRAGYSNYGARVDLMAPGGNGTAGTPYNFVALDNTGATVPEADTTSARAGTSFSAPLVSGVVALMLSVAPDLDAAQVRSLVKGSAKPFPAGSTCSTAICGAGILDAAGAVRAALAATGAPVPVTLVEYYHAGFDHYFMTWAAAEIALLDAGSIKGWARTGRTIPALMGAVAGTAAVCRIYIPPGKGDGHFFGRDATECDGTMAKNPTFVLESAAFFHLYPPSAGICPAGMVAVYRVYSNRADANHRYTIDRTVRDAMVAKGWVAEGDGPDVVAMCAPA
ncbi:MAG: S8 family serine peptidase [Burkholderiales bacterium]|nr:S8 family serine peptidase [Burkholderiales bacterium]